MIRCATWPGEIRDGEGLWWKLVNRNWRAIALDIKDDDRDTLLALLDRSRVVVENFRPGTLERLGLGPEVLTPRWPRLVIQRGVTGFGEPDGRSSAIGAPPALSPRSPSPFCRRRPAGWSSTSLLDSMFQMMFSYLHSYD